MCVVIPPEAIPCRELVGERRAGGRSDHVDTVVCGRAAAVRVRRPFGINIHSFLTNPALILIFKVIMFLLLLLLTIPAIVFGEFALLIITLNL